MTKVLSQAPISPSRVTPTIDKNSVDPQTRAAAEGMEAMFLDYMMQAMRQTVPENEMDLNSPATKIYQSMMDSENAQRSAKQGGLGLSDQIIAYLESARYNEARRNESPALKESPTVSTGGTNEGTKLGK